MICQSPKCLLLHPLAMQSVKHHLWSSLPACNAKKSMPECLWCCGLDDKYCTMHSLKVIIRQIPEDGNKCNSTIDTSPTVRRGVWEYVLTIHSGIEVRVVVWYTFRWMCNPNTFSDLKGLWQCTQGDVLLLSFNSRAIFNSFFAWEAGIFLYCKRRFPSSA